MANNKNNLPSINDFAGNYDDLPSIKEYLKESTSEEPVEKEEVLLEEVKEEKNTNSDGVLVEVLRLISDVRKDIPKVPEVKYYDEELEKLSEEIVRIREEVKETPEVKYYDVEIEAICDQIDSVKEYISESVSKIPEIRDNVSSLEETLSYLKDTVSNIPEVRYYEEELETLRSAINETKNSIPNVPHWVQETEDVPDFSWYVNVRKTFNDIGENFGNVRDSIQSITDKFDLEIEKIQEEKEVLSFETKIEKQALEEKLNQTKTEIWEEFKSTSSKIWEYHKEFKDDDRKLKKQILGEYNSLKQSVNEKLEKINNQSVETDELLLGYFNNLREEISNFPEVKYYDEDIDDVRQEVISVRQNVESVESDISNLYKLVDIIKTSQKQLKEEVQIVNEPTDKPQSVGAGKDPLTPMDQKFATLEDLSKHYSLFINRIQQQISTIGGGGAGFIKDLDDVSFDQTVGNNKLLIYDQANSKWVGIASTALGGGSVVGAAGTWTTDSVGIHTTKSVGIATTSAKAGISLYVVGDTEITGNISVAGTITYNDVTNVDSIGIVTARSGITVVGGGITVSGISTFYDHVDFNNNIFHTGIATFGSSNGIGTVTIGLGSTALYVDGDARIIGILTVGRASVTIDGNNNTITSGIVTITNSQIYLGDNITLSGSATGINSAHNVLYVAKDGNDENNGTSIDNAKLTISGAVGIATTGTVIKVLAGNYAENNPIEVPAFVSIVGDDLKTVTVTPNTATKDIFHVRKGCYLANMTFTNHTAPAAAIGFPTAEIATNVGGGKWESPYIQNCTSNTTTGTGLRIDGAQAEGLKSIVCDSYTQYNQGGVGVAITNEGFAQLVSVFTICCNEAITCYKGSTCDLTNSNSSFGTYGLVADGVSSLQSTGIVTSSAAAAQDNVVVNIGAGTTRPYDGQVVYFDQLYQSVETITVGSGGTGYTSTPTVTIDAPSGPNGETATAFATLEGESVSEITIISSGTQYIGTPNITISGPQSGINTATATASMSPIYYTINSSTPVVSGITTLTLDENLINTVGVGSTAYFYQQSKIVASSHTFEYVGSGNDITSATPKRGGVTVQANEVVTSNGGKVVYTSTDQAGNFRIGDELQINQNTGTISGRAFTRSLFSEMTPFILALS